MEVRKGGKGRERREAVTGPPWETRCNEGDRRWKRRETVREMPFGLVA
jgi:hypothetical protein